MLMTVAHHHQNYLPSSVARLENPQADLPRIAKDKKLLAEIEAAVQQIPTEHRLIQGDARKLSFIEDESVHLVVTSPPYWTLKKYRDHEDQLGEVEDYERFLLELDKVWEHCCRTLVPGGRLICVVGDVCLSRRKNDGRHTVVPLHASIQEHCRKIGYDNLAPIIWYKIANAAFFEASGNGAGFLGKPYEPNLFEGLTLMLLVRDLSSSKSDLTIILLVGLIAVGLPYGYLIGMIVGVVIAYLMNRGVITLGAKEP